MVGDNIERILVVTSNGDSTALLDEIMGIVEKYPDQNFISMKRDSVSAFWGLKINLNQRRVYCDNQEISLTAKEYDILCLFAENKGCILTYNQIYQKVWKEEAFGNANNAIACHVHNLRRKLVRLLPEGFFIIRCVREVGYCLESNSEHIAIT